MYLMVKIGRQLPIVTFMIIAGIACFVAPFLTPGTYRQHRAWFNPIVT